MSRVACYALDTLHCVINMQNETCNSQCSNKHKIHSIINSKYLFSTINDNYVDEEDNNFIAALTGQHRDVWAEVSIFSILEFCKLLCCN